MRKYTRFVGLDVHRDTIAVAVAEGECEPQALGTSPHHADALRKLVRRLGPPDALHICYDDRPDCPHQRRVEHRHAHRAGRRT